MEVSYLIKVTLTNEILQRILEIDENRFSLRAIELPPVTKNFLIPVIVKTRIRSYQLSEFVKANEKKKKKKLCVCISPAKNASYRPVCCK